MLLKKGTKKTNFIIRSFFLISKTTYLPELHIALFFFSAICYILFLKIVR